MIQQISFITFFEHILLTNKAFNNYDIIFSFNLSAIFLIENIRF